MLSITADEASCEMDDSLFSYKYTRRKKRSRCDIRMYFSSFVYRRCSYEA